MVQLPVQVAGSASSWRLQDFVSVQQSAAADTTGTITVAFSQLDDNELWLVDHAVISCTSATATVLRMYAGSVSALSLLDGSSAGAFDVADWPSGLVILPTSTLIVQWTGATSGSTGTITVQARSMRRT